MRSTLVEKGFGNFYTKAQVDALIAALHLEMFFKNVASSDIASYLQLSMTEVTTAESDIATASYNNGNDQAVTELVFATEPGQPALAELFAGIYEFHIHAKTSSTAGLRTATLYAKLYERKADNSEVLVLTSEHTSVFTTTLSEYDIHGSLSTNHLMSATTSRLVVKFFANIAGGAQSLTFATADATSSGMEIPVTIAALDARYEPLANLTPGKLPAAGSTGKTLINSNAFYDGANIGVGTVAPVSLLTVAGQTFTEYTLSYLPTNLDAAGIIIGNNIVTSPGWTEFDFAVLPDVASGNYAGSAFMFGQINLITHAFEPQWIFCGEQYDSTDPTTKDFLISRANTDNQLMILDNRDVIIGGNTNLTTKLGGTLYAKGDGKVNIPNLTASKMVVTDASKNLASGTNTDAQVAAAVTASHAAVSLNANADTILSLSTQALGLDTQAANLVFAGPVSGAAAVPAFRAPVSADVSGLIYVDRGDPAAADFTKASFTIDNAYHDLSLAGILPVGAKAVILFLFAQGDAAAKNILFRKNGNSNEFNLGQLVTQVANQGIFGQIIIGVDANRVIEYRINSAGVTWATLYMTIVGWFM